MIAEQASKLQFLTAKQLATMLSVSPRSVWRLKASHKLPRPVQIGGSTRWRQFDIESWQDKGCPDQKMCQTRTEVQK